MRLCAAALGLVIGCSILPEAKPASIEYYSVDPGEVKPVERPYPARLTVRGFTAPARYSHSVVRRVSPYQVAFEELRRWVEPPAELARDALERLIRGSNLFQPSEEDPEWFMEGRVLVFDEVVEGGASSAQCRIRIELYRRKTGEKIYGHEEGASAALGAGGLAEAMSRALRETAEKLIQSMLDARLK
jgi:hypothetical protein